MYKTYLPFVVSDGPKWRKRGVAGFTWSNIREEYRWSKSKITWGHSWTPRHGVVDGVTNVPTIFARHRNELRVYGFEYAKEVIPSSWSEPLLMINEPRERSQANMTPHEAVDLWMDTCYTFPYAKLVGPQMLMSFQGRTHDYSAAQVWLSEFWEGLPERGKQRMHAHSYHNYLYDVEEHTGRSSEWMDWCDSCLTPLPYWITEWGIDGRHHSDGGADAVLRIRDWYDQEPRVDKHAYYIPYADTISAWGAPWVHHRLFDDSGYPNERGVAWLS